MKLEPAHVAVLQAQMRVQLALHKLQEETGLTDLEMLSALSAWSRSALSLLERDERHARTGFDPSASECAELAG